MDDGRPLLLFVGLATIDTVAVVSRYPGPDERAEADDIVTAGGGTAATAAVAASRLGARTALIGRVGDDEPGKRVLAELAAEGVDVSAVQCDPSIPTAASVIVATASSGRAISTRPQPALRLPPDGRAARLLAVAEWVHVDHLGWPALPLGTLGRTRVSVDGGNPIDGFAPRGVQLYVPTLAALRQRYGEQEPADVLGAARAEGAHVVVATDGANGAWAASSTQPPVHVPAMPGPIRSTLGAGDVFHGALLAAVGSGRPLPEAVLVANRVAGLSCRAVDGRSAIPTGEEYLDLFGTSPTSAPGPFPMS